MSNHTIELSDLNVTKVIDIACFVDAKMSKRLDMVVTIENENVNTVYKLSKNKKVSYYDTLGDAVSWYNSL